MLCVRISRNFQLCRNVRQCSNFCASLINNSSNFKSRITKFRLQCFSRYKHSDTSHAISKQSAPFLTSFKFSPTYRYVNPSLWQNRREDVRA